MEEKRCNDHVHRQNIPVRKGFVNIDITSSADTVTCRVWSIC